MTVQNYVTTPVPANNCLDSPTVNQWLQNANEIAYCAQVGQGGVRCVAVNGLISEGECFEVSNLGLTANPADVNLLALDKKSLIGVAHVDIADYVDTFQAGVDTVGVNTQGFGQFYAVLLCDGEVVSSTGTFSINGSGVVPLNGLACCPRGSKMEVCIRRFTGTGAGVFSSRLCGAMICVQSPYKSALSSLGGFCCAPPIPAGCTVGRAGIELLRQNVQALCAYAARGVSQITCPANVSFTGSASQNIHTLQNDAEYLVIGQITICGIIISIPVPDGPYATSVTVNPRVFCGGTETGCESTQRLEGTGSGRMGCLTFPVYACGKCKAGDDIFAGFDDPTGQCDFDGSAINLVTPGFSITSITQSYTVYVIGKTDPVADGSISPAPNAFLDKCISDQSVIDLVDKSDELATYYNGLGLFNPYCERVNTSNVIPLGDSFATLLRPAFALPVPPPVPLPVPWPPIKKTLITGGMEFCIPIGSNMSQPFTVTVEIQCNGAPVETYPFTWPGGGGTLIERFCQQSFLNIAVDCPVDQQVNYVVNTTGNPAIDLTINTDFFVVCL